MQLHRNRPGIDAFALWDAVYKCVRAFLSHSGRHALFRQFTLPQRSSPECSIEGRGMNARAANTWRSFRFQHPDQKIKMDKRLAKRHKRQVSQARERLVSSEPDLRTPEQVRAAREAISYARDEKFGK